MTSLTSTLTLQLKDNVSKPARSVAMALRDVEANIKLVAKGMASTGATDKFVASLAKLKLTKADIQSVANAWRDYAKSAALAADSSQWTAKQISDVRNWERATLSALRTVKSEQAAYARQLAQMPAAAATPGLMRRAGGAIGGLLPFAGPAILGAVAKSVEGAAQLQGQDIANKVAGIPLTERVAANRQAIVLSAKYANLGAAEVMQTYRELRSVLRDTADVPGMMDVVVRAKSAMAASGLDESGLVYALKSAEMLGKAGSPGQMTAFLDAFLKAQQVEGKTITPEQLFDFAQQLKAAAPNLSAGFVNTLGPLLAQEMTGGRAGTSVQQFERQIQGGFQGQLHAAAKEFVSIGLAKKTDFETTKTGEIKGMKRGHTVVGAELANTDPDKWVYTVLVPALHKAGFKTTEEMIKELPRLFPNSNAANLVAKFIQQQDQWAAKADRVAAGEGLNAANDQMSGVTVAWAAVKKQIGDLGAVFDSPAMKDIGAGLSALARGIGEAKVKVYDFAQAFPRAARGLADVGVAAGLAAGGFLSLKLFTGFTGGFGLKTSALALDESAAALTAAAERLGVSGGVGPDGKPSKKGGSWLGGWGWPLFGATVAKTAADITDPEGNFWGLTKPLDRWMQSHWGFNFSALDVVPAEASPEKDMIVGAKPLNDVSSGADPWAPGGAWANAGRMRAGLGAPLDLHPGFGGAGAPAAANQSPTLALNPDGSLVPLKPKADEAKAALDALNAVVKPDVDLSALDAAIARIAQVRDGLAALGRLGAGSVPSLGSTQRGHFTFGGVSGE
ncbi:MAG: hypothetical protein ABSF67_02690 [Roseiarcus sp.]|jgi:hypothetical protein